MFDNKIKIWASGNYLTKIPEEDKNAMFTSRLSLITNTRKIPYDEDPELAENVIKNEAEKIISWILNFTDKECQYEDKETIQSEWEGISSPEIGYLENNWQLSDEETETSVMKILNDCRDKTKKIVSIEQMKKSLQGLGYVVRYNIIKNIEIKPEKWKKPTGKDQKIVEDNE